MVKRGTWWSSAPGLSGLGSSIASVMFIYTMFRRYFPDHLRLKVEKYFDRVFSFYNPYIEIVIHEYCGGRLRRNEAYVAIRTYLGANSTEQAKRLKADVDRNSKSLVLSMGDYEEVTDEYHGVQFCWSLRKTPSTRHHKPFYGADDEADDNQYYKLTFHRKHRSLVTETYLNHVFEEGKALRVKSRQRKIYTNNPITNMNNPRSVPMWSHLVFKHPSTFRTLAMDEEKKNDIIDDLTTFRESKDYYAEIGKSWKRGYLLYGPPGTGKSTMIAAIANFLEYDIYDLELTAVRDNHGLRKLLIETSDKSIIVIEDIDCSLDLTGQRKKKEEKEIEEGNETKDQVLRRRRETMGREESHVTLSGLLNFIDGLWSACGEERLIIFTTNYVDKLDPALIRSGRMDKHIELSYCSYGSFKVLAKNYLGLDSHHLFGTVKQLLEESDISPADVAENLMPKTRKGDFAEHCLENLIKALKTIKEEEVRLKAEATAKDSKLSYKEKLDAENSLTGSQRMIKQAMMTAAKVTTYNLSTPSRINTKRN